MEGVVDHDSLQAGAFASAGGFGTINKVISGRPPELPEALHAEVGKIHPMRTIHLTG